MVGIGDRQPHAVKAEDAHVGPARVVHRLAREPLETRECLVEITERQLAQE
jgi:hypothetical protein